MEAADEIWTRDHLLSFETGTRQVLYQASRSKRLASLSYRGAFEPKRNSHYNYSYREGLPCKVSTKSLRFFLIVRILKYTPSSPRIYSEICLSVKPALIKESTLELSQFGHLLRNTLAEASFSRATRRYVDKCGLKI